MGVQTSYNYGTQKGIAGGLYDISTHAIDTRISEEESLHFGYGVVEGTNPGTGVKLPTSAATAEQFEGLVINGFTTQQTMKGDTFIEKGQSLGIMVYGNAWGCVASNASAAYGKTVYLITDGAEAGLFTTEEDTATKIELRAEFLSGADAKLAPIRFFNVKN